MLERDDARLRAKAGGIERRCRLGETHGGFGIEAVTEANGKAGIEGIPAAAGAFDLHIEGRHLEMRAIGIMIIGPVGAACEDAGADPAIDEVFRIVGKASSIEGMK